MLQPLILLGEWWAFFKTLTLLFPMILEKYSMGFMGEKSSESLYTIKSMASGFTYHIIIFQFSPYQTRDFGLEINGHD